MGEPINTSSSKPQRPQADGEEGPKSHVGIGQARLSMRVYLLRGGARASENTHLDVWFIRQTLQQPVKCASLGQAPP